ncbi:MAG: hypothetical protein OHK0040_05710 [bacterium]
MKRFFDTIDKTLKSVKFAVFLMLLIGAASIYGTIFPARTPFDFNLYKTPPFILLLFLFAVHIAYCTLFRLLKQSKTRLSNKTGGKEIARVPLETDLVNKLKKRGFKTEEVAEGLYLHKGSMRIRCVLLIHLALVLLLIAVGLSSLTGFLGTANVHVGDKLSSCFDWNKKVDVPLPFDIIVDKAEILYYPMPIKVLAEDMISGQRELITTKEEEKVTFASHIFKIVKAQPATGRMLINLIKDSKETGPFENVVATDDLKVRFTLKAYIDPIPKQYVADIAVFENRVEKASKRISINDPLFYKGYRIYLLNIDKDEYNFDFVGFQITKEPFMGPIWFSCILLCLSLLLYPFMKEFRMRIEQKDGELVIYALPPIHNTEELVSSLLTDNHL